MISEECFCLGLPCQTSNTFYSVINEVFFLFYFCSTLFEGPTKLYNETISALSLKHTDALVGKKLPFICHQRSPSSVAPLVRGQENKTTKTKTTKTNRNICFEKYTFFPLFSWTTVKGVRGCEKVKCTAKKP